MLKNYKKTETKDMFPEGENPVLGNEKDVHIFTRYFIIAVLLGAVAITILIFAFKIGVYERKEWLKVAEGLNQPDRLVNPERGTIYSSDDRIMAANFPQFYLYMDFKSEAILIDSLLKSKRNNVDSLAYYLSRKLKNRTPAEYKALILRGVQSKSPEYPIYVQKGISLLDLNEIEKFPFFRLGMYKNGLIKKERIFRQKPFDKLASRTIGDVYGEIDAKTGLTKGRNGLEMQYDSLLRGEAGLSSIQRVGGRWVSVVEQSPVNGMDVRSTIDINIQDLVEKSLTDKLKELDAEIGIAIVMEVKTGEIKAITNMARRSYGQYDETLNHAVADMIEPGSTFKVAAMMVALDDGVVDAKTPVDAGNGIFMYANQRMEDHNANRGGYGLINAEKSIWYSSNIGVSKLILNGYSSNPRKFVEGLRRVGMDADLNVEIPGAGESILRWPDDRLWSRGSLPWMSFGYEVRMPPIQILTFYNAIANNGKMVRPMFVKNILKNGKSMRQFKTEVIIPEICSKKTLNIIQDMLYNVVNYEDPTPANRNGTGRPARSDLITIAGKTGTAQIAGGGGYGMYGHNVSFCGYFPYENPQYTCIVVISRPRNGIPSGGAMCGTVVKDIAEKIYAGKMTLDMSTVTADMPKVVYPQVKNGDYNATKNAASSLSLTTNEEKSIQTPFVLTSANTRGITIREMPSSNGLVPNVVGMGAKDAVFALEGLGLRVLLSGQGRVVSQSVQGGARLVSGQRVTLTLR